MRSSASRQPALDPLRDRVSTFPDNKSPLVFEKHLYVSCDNPDLSCRQPRNSNDLRVLFTSASVIRHALQHLSTDFVGKAVDNLLTCSVTH